MEQTLNRNQFKISTLLMVMAVVCFAFGGAQLYERFIHRITANEAARIRPGMTKGEVRQILGRPHRGNDVKGMQGAAYFYRSAFTTCHGDQFLVSFDEQGRVFYFSK